MVSFHNDNMQLRDHRQQHHIDQSVFLDGHRIGTSSSDRTTVNPTRIGGTTRKDHSDKRREQNRAR
jgi:hypothetical protein